MSEGWFTYFSLVTLPTTVIESKPTNQASV